MKKTRNDFRDASGLHLSAETATRGARRPSRMSDKTASCFNSIKAAQATMNVFGRRHPPMITVHHLNNSRSQRVLWLLEELGLPYEIKHYQRDPQTMLAPDSLRQVHALGKSPVITDGEATVAESGAIVEYLVEHHGQGALVPAAGTAERLRYTYWLHFAEGSAMSPLLMKLVFDKVTTSPMPFFAKPIAKAISAKVLSSFVTPNIERQLDYMEAELGRSTWFAGKDFSAADIQMSFPLEAAAQRAGLNASRPKLMAFLKRIHARPAYKKALERGGPYSFAND
jgi:glutathione S-transferase